ncbi:MAG: cytochrome c-type biogenesis CcmF C-terminal domain-containing protein, partial [Arenimonas sp.]
AFSLSLMGTFLVRSGVLTSVHAFASDPQRGLFILVFLSIVVGGSLALFAWRAPREEGGAPFAAASRETLLLLNNLLLSAAAAMILLGTLYPLLAEALDLGRISVGPPYFRLLFTLLMAPLVLLLPFGPLTRWQREQPSTPLRWLLPWAVLALIGAAITFLAWPASTWRTAAAVAAGTWLAFGTLRFLWQRLLVSRQRLSAEMLGMVFAHAGLAVFFFGVLVTESTSVEHDVAAKPGQSFELRGYEFRFMGVETVDGPNYQAERGRVEVTRGGAPVATMRPEKRAYASGGNVMTEADINGRVSRDLYVALGEPLGDDGSWALRLYVKPWIRMIWLGALLMAIGGFTVVLDRRFRTPVAAAPSRHSP